MPTAFADSTDNKPIRDCAVTSQVGETCMLRIETIRPTQFAVGYRAIQIEEHDLSKMSPKDLEKEIKDKPAPLVIAPGGAFYIYDRHHFAVSLLGVGVHEMRAEVHANWLRMAPQEFFPAMEHNNWVWLYDENGRPASAGELPPTLMKLSDDPYRSLSDAVQDEKGFEKSDVPFAAFFWANFFRDRIPLGHGEADFERAISQATALAQTKAARGLPGYKGP